MSNEELGEEYMEASDITRNHTRAEMNELAKDIGIDNPTTYRNKKELAEAMIPLMEETSDEMGIQEAIEDIRSSMDDLKATELPIDSFIERFDEAVKKEKIGEFEEAIRLIDDLQNDRELIFEIKEKVQVIDELIEFLGSHDIDEDGEERRDKIIEYIEHESYIHASEEAGEVLNWLEERKEDVRSMKETVDERLSQARKRLSELRDTPIKLDGVKELVKESAKAKKENKINLALEKVDMALERSDKVEEIFDGLKEGKELIRKIKKKGLIYKSYLDTLKTGKKKADEGDYKYSLQLLNDAIQDMKQEIEEADELKFEREEVEKKVRDILRKVEAIENALKIIKKDIDDILK